MKTLKHLQVAGLKNHERTEMVVGRLLALSGPNGVGKTTLLQAIRLGVLGHEPTVGRTLAATRLLAAGDGDIRVALSFDDGFGIRRAFGKSQETDVAPPKGERTEKERQARIDDETGAFVPSFDLAAFLSLSSEKRRAMLFGLLPREAVGLTVEVFREWLGYDGSDDPIRRAIDKLWTDKVMAEQSPIDGLASALAFAREHMLEAENQRQAQVKVLEAAERDAEQASAAVDYDPAEAERLQEEAFAIEKRISDLAARAGEAERIQRQHSERQHNLQVLAMKAERLGQDLEAARQRAQAMDPATDPRTLQVRADLALAEERLAACVPPTAEEIQEAEHAAEHAARKVRAHRDAIEATSERLHALQAELRATEAQLDALTNVDACPICGSAADLEATRVRLRAEIERLGADVQRAADAQAAARSLQRELDTEEARRREDLRRLQDRAGQHRDMTAVVRERAAAVEAAGRDFDRRRGEAEAEVGRLQAQVEATAGERERLAAMDLPPVPEVETDLLEELGGQADALRARLREQREAMKAAGRAEAERGRAGRERSELDKRTARAERLKTLHRGLQKLRGHVIQQLVGPVEATANEILQKIDPDKRFAFVFEREGRDVFDFGFEEAGVFRSYDAASTGEDAFLAVVLVAALIAAVQPAWPVLIVDNVESIDDERRRWLMAAIAEVADRFANVILAGCCEFAGVEGWEIVDVQELRGLAAQPTAEAA